MRPVFGLIGDGGLQFTIGDMASATEAGTSVRLILWNNSGYGEIKSYMVNAGVPPVGVDIYTPHFEPIARGFGWTYRKVSSIGEFAAALAERLQPATKSSRSTKPLSRRASQEATNERESGTRLVSRSPTSAAACSGFTNRMYIGSSAPTSSCCMAATQTC